jgi:hypothetical protein
VKLIKVLPTSTFRPTARSVHQSVAASRRKVPDWRAMTSIGASLRRTPEGRWFCCEVNPSPGFTVCQQATGRRILQAIADLLAVGRRFARSMRISFVA